MTVWYPPPLARAASTVTLTPRQADVLTGMCHGLSNREIGRRLALSEDTVKTYVKQLLRIFGARSRTHATALAVSGQIGIDIERARRSA